MRGYGRDYGDSYGYRDRPEGRSRGQWGWSGMPGGWEGRRAFGRYDAPLRGPGPVAQGGARPEFGSRFGYWQGADLQGDDYDRGYKSRWRTDYGDPYRDRIRRTPMRLVREDPHGYSGSDRYGRDFGRSPYPISDRSYETRRGYDASSYGIRERPQSYEQTGWNWPI